MDQFVEDQEKEARAQMDVLVADYQDMLERLQLAHDRKLNELKADRNRSKDKARQQYETLLEQHKRLQSDYDTLSQQHEAQRDQLEMRIKELQAKLNDNLMVANPVPHSNLQHSTEPSSQDEQVKDEAGNDGEINNRQLILVQQHKNELQLLYRQYQQSLETKDRDLEAYAYRLESLKVAQQRELASCQSEAKHRIRLLVCQMEGYKTTIQGYINTLDETQSHIATLEQQKNHDWYTIQKLTREKQMLEDRLSRLHPLNG